jgi:hypothetical protein
MASNAVCEALRGLGGGRCGLVSGWLTRRRAPDCLAVVTRRSIPDCFKRINSLNACRASGTERVLLPLLLPCARALNAKPLSLLAF